MIDQNSSLEDLWAYIMELQDELALKVREIESLQGDVIPEMKVLWEEVQKLNGIVADGYKERDRNLKQISEQKKQIDDLIKEVKNTKSELDISKKTNISLETKIDELRIELRKAQDQLAKRGKRHVIFRTR